MYKKYSLFKVRRMFFLHILHFFLLYLSIHKLAQFFVQR